MSSGLEGSAQELPRAPKRRRPDDAPSKETAKEQEQPPQRGDDDSSDGTPPLMPPVMLECTTLAEQIRYSAMADVPPPVLPLNNYRLLGSTGLCVSPICLGTLHFGDNWSAMTGAITRSEAEAVMDTYVGLGGNFIDTANTYQDGETEEWIGDWMAKRSIRDQMVLTTKWSMVTKRGAINSAGNSRKALFQAIDDSLHRLRTSYIDLLQMHAWDFKTPAAEIMRALDDLVRSGKVHYIAFSDTPAWFVATCATMAELRGWAPISAARMRYNLGDRDVEAELMPMCKAHGIGALTWGPLGPRLDASTFGHEALDQAVDAVAAQTGTSRTQVALAWELSNPQVCSTVVNCIKSPEQIRSYAAAARFRLSPEHLRVLNEATTRQKWFPFNFIGDSWQTSPFYRAAGTIEGSF
eukprot:m51a1_g365 hypothetical protein (409) ;mRNA; r:602421-603871